MTAGEIAVIIAAVAFVVGAMLALYDGEDGMPWLLAVLLSGGGLLLFCCAVYALVALVHLAWRQS